MVLRTKQTHLELEKLIDLRFMEMFNMQPMARDKQTMECRGCAAKLPAQSLEKAFKKQITEYGVKPEDAVQLDECWSQSVDGFPALVTDPWRTQESQHCMPVPIYGLVGKRFTQPRRY